MTPLISTIQHFRTPAQNVVLKQFGKYYKTDRITVLANNVIGVASTMAGKYGSMNQKLQNTWHQTRVCELVTGPLTFIQFMNFLLPTLTIYRFHG